MLFADSHIAILVVLLPAILMISLLCRRTGIPRALVAILSIAAVLLYIDWRIGTLLDSFGRPAWSGQVWTWVFAVIEGFGLFELLIFLAMFSRRRDNSGAADRSEKLLRGMLPEQLPEVDVYVATYNEEWTILEKTIIGIKALDWPANKLKVWILDDGRRSWLDERCREMGINYVTRPDSRGKKAGNHNHALSVTNAPFILSLDADFVPFANFLYRTIGFMLDPKDTKVAVVQTPQSFYNTDVTRANLGLWSDCSDDLEMFYREIQPSRDAWNCAFYCGSSALIRRSAIESIGGFETQTDIEDQATSVKLLAKGWHARYLCERLSLGLSAESTAAFHDQRNRWCRGSLQIAWMPYGPFGRGLNLIQRLLFSQFHWVVGATTPLAYVAAPLLIWLLDWQPYPPARPEELLAVPAMVFAIISTAIWWLSSGWWLPLLSPAQQMFLAVELLPTVLTSLIKPFGKPLIKINPVTDKGPMAVTKRVDVFTASMLGLLLVAMLVSLAMAALTDGGPYNSPLQRLAAVLWTLYGLSVTSLAFLMCFQPRVARTEERFEIGEKAKLLVHADGMPTPVRLVDLSLNGGCITAARGSDLAIVFDWIKPGRRVSLQIDGVGVVSGTVVRAALGSMGIKFEDVNDAQRHALIRRTYATAPKDRQTVMPLTALIGGLFKVVTK
ncbi:MAG: hypothetical protein JWM57_458 [Phycisphaerales bacterium]|nr:hypothetical protein [Phycisphaerales bacterium]